MIRNIFRQISPRIAIMITNQLTTLFSIPWLAAHLNIELFGLIATCLILIQTGWIIIDWGGMNYSTEIWKSKQSITIKNELVTNITSSKLFLGLIYLSVIAVFIFLDMVNLPWIFFLMSIPAAIAGGIFPLWFYHVTKKPSDLVFITFIIRLIFLICVIIFIKDDSDALLYLILFSGTITIITIYAFARMIFKYSFRWHNFSYKSAFKHIRRSTSFLINSVTNNHIQSVWSISLALTGSPLAIAIYNIAEQGYRAGNAISNTISQVIRINSINNSPYKTFKLILFFVMIYFFTACFFYLVSDSLIKFLFPSEFLNAIIILKVMIVVWFIQSLIHIVNYPILGKLIGVIEVHRLNPIFIFLHGICLVFWLLSSNSVFNMVFFLAFASILQLLIMFYLIIRNYKN